MSLRIFHFSSISESSLLPRFSTNWDPSSLSLTTRSHRELWQHARPVMIRCRKWSQDSRNPVGEIWLRLLIWLSRHLAFAYLFALSAFACLVCLLSSPLIALFIYLSHCSLIIISAFIYFICFICCFNLSTSFIPAFHCHACVIIALIHAFCLMLGLFYTSMLSHYTDAHAMPYLPFVVLIAFYFH